MTRAALLPITFAVLVAAACQEPCDALRGSCARVDTRIESLVDKSLVERCRTTPDAGAPEACEALVAECAAECAPVRLIDEAADVHGCWLSDSAPQLKVCFGPDAPTCATSSDPARTWAWWTDPRAPTPGRCGTYDELTPEAGTDGDGVVRLSGFNGAGTSRCLRVLEREGELLTSGGGDSLGDCTTAAEFFTIRWKRQ